MGNGGGFVKVCSTKGKEGEINQSVARSNLLPPPLCLSVYTYVIKKLVSLSQFLAPPLVIRGSFCLAKSRPPPPPPPPPIAATKNLFCLCQSSGERREEVGRGDFMYAFFFLLECYYQGKRRRKWARFERKGGAKKEN